MLNFDFEALKKRKEDNKDLIKRFNEKKDYYFNFYSERFLARGYDKRNAELFDTLTQFSAYYFAKLNKKGLFLCAKESDINTGVGKTLGMQVISDLFTIRIETALKLSEAYCDNDERYLEMLTSPNYYDSTKRFDLIIDEVGAEPISNNFGKKMEVFVDVLETRYNSFIQHGAFTHFTSNLTITQIETRYGHRVWSRINEICKVIEISGTDRRFE